MPEQVILNDGTSLDGDITEAIDGVTIYVRLYNMRLEAGFLIMRDAGKTIRIKAVSHGIERTYNGYTEIVSINCEFGNCNLAMRKVVSA